MIRDLVIIGVGGVGRALRLFVEDVNRMQPRWRFEGFVDDAPELQGREISGGQVLGPVDWLKDQNVDVLVGVGAPESRQIVVNRLKSFQGVSFPTLMHPRAYIPSEVPVGQGTIVYPGATIDPDTRLGSFVIVNQNVTIGHDTIAGDYASLAPGACIGGAVTIGEGADIGIGANCVQGVTLGAGCRVGAGAAVIRDVEPGKTVVGVPAAPK